MDDQPDTTRLYAVFPGDDPGHLRVTRCPVCMALVESHVIAEHRRWHADRRAG